jgi:hypothetical protein
MLWIYVRLHTNNVIKYTSKIQQRWVRTQTLGLNNPRFLTNTFFLVVFFIKKEWKWEHIVTYSHKLLGKKFHF